MTQFTIAPRPWIIDGHAIQSIDHGRYFTICRIAPEYFTPSARMAHTNLIAAAPDLLETLEGILPEFQAYADSDSDDEIRERGLAWVVQAMTIIAKAKGGAA